MKSRKNLMWTEAVYRLLYEQLVKQFGPLDTWPSHSAPRDRYAYERFCARFAATVGSESSEAVKHQIAHAMGITGNKAHSWEKSRFRVIVLNMAAAYHAGFIRHGHFPDVIARKPDARMRHLTTQQLISRGVDLSNPKIKLKRMEHRP